MESDKLIVPQSQHNNNIVKRKFLAEAGVNLYSGGATVFRPTDLYRFGQASNVRAALVGCNIYLVCRRRRISIDPYTLRVSSGLLYGDFRLHGPDIFDFDRYPFAQAQHFQSNDGQPLWLTAAETSNSSGFDVVVMDELNRRSTIPAHVLISNTSHKLSNHTTLEVLYVGQAYGQHGKRLTVDRLSDHTTFQRILAESIESNPCDEVLLLFFRYEHARNIISTAGDFSIEPSASREEEQKHLQHCGELKLDRRTRITLAEAALINYFKPAYNIMHKNSFQPDRMKRLKTLEKLFKLDLSALIVEINTSNFKSKLSSASAPAAKLNDFFDNPTIERFESKTWIEENGISQTERDQFIADMTHAHIARFALYNKSERESFLHALPWS
ncbi:hypothetical protein [Burkholderia lata]|uniref:Uncharacterized protein n=1 Tax=Burkholderia lata (strain ATCC 17760 / DSM 23089 / LMG 22485 / NCIMB 9086 / R18194 / 383) TaxID=482957 RepID=A0A6P2S8J8_BURL3|nr:hypothetical protein [Burkholderia lata]VWC46424.1 hypothetical protein BLA6863_07451 [Burkholderia lata]